MKQLNQQQAIKFATLKIYESMSLLERAAFQLEQELLCMPFDVFHEAITVALNRDVFTHEFAHFEELKKEFYGEKESPTFEEIMNLIPEEKRIIFYETT